MSEEDIGENEDLKEVVHAEDSELKNLIVNFVGTTLNLEKEVTVENIVQVFAEQFPEFVLVLAEENFLRGYKQALADIHAYQQFEEEQQAEA